MVRSNYNLRGIDICLQSKLVLRCGIHARNERTPVWMAVCYSRDDRGGCEERDEEGEEGVHCWLVVEEAF